MAVSDARRSEVRRLARDARFIFTGFVEAEGGSTLTFVPPGSASLVVRVERIHHAPPQLHGQQGQRLTVLTAFAGGAAIPHRVFFTNPVLFGETLGVRELGSMEAVDINGLHDLIARAVEEEAVNKLREHLAAADAVVHGRVLRRHRVSDATPATVSEHDPDWWVAVLHIEAALKGAHEGELPIRFPNSRDVRWWRVPRPQDGQNAIFVLHRDGVRLGEATLALLHPDDMLSAGPQELRRIRSLL